MSKFFHRWLSSSLWLQGISVSFLFTLMAVLLWGLWGLPVRQEGLRLIQQQRQQITACQRLMRTLATRGTLAGIEAEIAQLRKTVEPVRGQGFSLQKLTEVSAGSLVEWQPTSQGGSLDLLLSWPQVQGVFGYLVALSSGVALPHFTLKPEKQQLRLHLSLVIDDED